MAPSTYHQTNQLFPTKAGVTDAKYNTKAPQPPKRLRSAFIMFSAEKHKEIRAALSEKGISEKTTNVAKLVSNAWKMLEPSERKIWEDKALQDKVRYQAEKDMFKGAWKMKRRKDPAAPKRPMSAYLAFSNSRRAIATKENPVATNSEISKILSKMWKEAPPEVKQKYVDEEAALREQYKLDMAEWKKKAKEMKRNNRKALAAEARKNNKEYEDTSFCNDSASDRSPDLSSALRSPAVSASAIDGLQFPINASASLRLGALYSENPILMRALPSALTLPALRNSFNTSVDPLYDVLPGQSNLLNQLATGGPLGPLRASDLGAINERQIGQLRSSLGGAANGPTLQDYLAMSDLRGPRRVLGYGGHNLFNGSNLY